MTLIAKFFLACLAACVLPIASVNATTVSYVQTPTTYFGPTSAHIVDAPYARFGNQDWSWSQASTTAPFTSAALSITAYDVDVGEVDNIYAYDSNGATGIWVLLGALTGADKQYSTTTFNLGSNFFDDIVNGLKLKIDIDVLQNGQLAVALTNSQIILGTKPNTVPEPSSLMLVAVALGVLTIFYRRRGGLKQPH